MKISLRKLFSKKRKDEQSGGGTLDGDENRSPVVRVEKQENIDSDIEQVPASKSNLRLIFHESKKRGNYVGAPSEDNSSNEVKPRSLLERFAFEKMSNHLPKLSGYREIYEQAGIPKIYESYLSSALFLSIIVSVPVFVASFSVEVYFRTQVIPSIFGSAILGGVSSAASLALWLFYPVQRRNNFKNKLESQLPYSFGVLGVLAASGMTVDRLFEGISSSDSNPVLAGLARRFLRNVKVFGMDIESALHEVANHSPSPAFSKMLESISVAFRTTGSLHNLIMFESGRLFSEKREKLKKSVNSLAVMAELYITLIVVGPIIFIVMLTIFLFLPAGGHSALPDPTLLINILIFIGIPALSSMFVLMLDSMVQKV